jgi:hypothetical protein
MNMEILRVYNKTMNKYMKNLSKKLIGYNNKLRIIMI